MRSCFGRRRHGLAPLTSTGTCPVTSRSISLLLPRKRVHGTEYFWNQANSVRMLAQSHVSDQFRLLVSDLPDHKFLGKSLMASRLACAKRNRTLRATCRGGAETVVFFLPADKSNQLKNPISVVTNRSSHRLRISDSRNHFRGEDSLTSRAPMTAIVLCRVLLRTKWPVPEKPHKKFLVSLPYGDYLRNTLFKHCDTPEN